jgi:hypothetical protein
MKKFLRTLEKKKKTEISTTEVPGTYFITIREGWPGMYDFEIHFSDNPYQICVVNSWTVSNTVYLLFKCEIHFPLVFYSTEETVC